MAFLYGFDSLESKGPWGPWGQRYISDEGLDGMEVITDIVLERGACVQLVNDFIALFINAVDFGDNGVKFKEPLLRNSRGGIPVHVVQDHRELFVDHVEHVDDLGFRRHLCDPPCKWGPRLGIMGLFLPFYPLRCVI